MTAIRNDAKLRALFSETPAPPVRSGAVRRVGRPKGGSPELTREQILNAAEELFAANGFDATGVRDIAAASGVQVAAVTYHFGPKGSLFDAVIRRRAEIMTTLRDDDLAILNDIHGGSPIPIDELVRAYVRPFIKSAAHGDMGWRNYAALMGRLANSALGTEVIARHYDRTASAYLSAFRAALPTVPDAHLVEGFTYMVAAMLSLCADTGRAERLGDNRAVPHDIDKALEPLVTFVTCGFEALPRMNQTR